ncbi:MAG: hypothetical protein OHK006_06010 [Thermodesulfovibrionales bacterium]
MNPAGSVILMVVNYSHDIATAFLTVSGLALWMLSRSFPEDGGKAARRRFTDLYDRVRRMTRYSLEWVLLAGVPRIVFYRSFEWSNRAGDLQVVAIVIKHIVMFTLVGGGVYFWLNLHRRVKQMHIHQTYT